MGRQIEKLIGVAGPALSPAGPLPAEILERAGPLAGELLGLLEKKSGFYAFESALHVLPAQSCGAEIGLVDWNSEKLWIGQYQGLAEGSLYQGLAEGSLFFAEDLFGVQFCIRPDGIYQFDPETAQANKLATSLEGWADAILRNYSQLTGYPFAHLWQQENGRIEPGLRLVPKRLFVMGGEFSVENLYLLDAVTAMRFRASVAIRIKDIPDGAQVRFKFNTDC